MRDHQKKVEESAAAASRTELKGPILVGVVPGQPLIVIRQAADLAYSLGVELVFAYVDVTRYLVQDNDGTGSRSAPIDPDGVDEPDDVEGTASSIREVIAMELGSDEVKWTFVSLAGEPARSLGRLAADVFACLIVVGTRERGVGARLEQLLLGSVAVHLTHRQLRPVLVIPLDPHAARDASQWH
ncbi:nucleotide-binding universal stress UspA family protein [Arthrobacter sp. UYCu511]|uniref:universal stress protein n=1 Tax=Arthrobacter sp. UYCu511 TaxID=3156337 RepID=UPI003393B66C